MAPPKDRNAENLADLRLRSRQAYLAKREQEQLALLERQVADEAQELRTNSKLSDAERREFAKNRETLKLARERLAIDDHTTGYLVPDVDLSDKTEILNRRSNEEYKSEVQQWEDEQTAKVKTQISRGGAKVQQDDYEFVFDESAAPQFVMDAASRLDPEKAKLEQMLNAAEKKAQSIEETRKSLPIWAYREELMSAIQDHQVLIVSAETGSGKSTQIVQFCRDFGLTKNGMKVGCTQPRRVAAMSVATRVAEEVGCRVGEEVGYSIRFEQKTSDKTVIKFLTDGMLLRETLTEPDLASYSVIILDEAHERSVSTDLLMGLLKDLLRLRTDLKIIISSATADSIKFSKFFSDAPVFNIPGRRFSVDIHYTPQPEANYLQSSVSVVMQIHISQPLAVPDGPLSGDILVFLTGQDEIEMAEQYLQETTRKLGGRIPELTICPIYANLPSDLQAKIFEPAARGARKVILATNIAETSLTVDGVTYVVDTGFEKQNVYSAKTRTESLVVVPCSRASSNQRAGRAGRTGPGKCFRLFTKYAFHSEMEASTTPEIQRMNLTSVVLMLKSLGINDLVNFDFMDPPSPDVLMSALEQLYGLGAISDQGGVTKIGRQMSEFPTDPFLAKSLIASDKYGCVEEVLSIVAMLSESGSLFFRPKDKKLLADAARARFNNKDGGDMLSLLAIWNQWVDADFDPRWARENFLQERTLKRVRDVREQLEKLCERVGIQISSAGAADHVAIRKALTAGFFMNCCRISRDGLAYRTVANGMSVYIHPSSYLIETRPKWVVYYELVLTSKEYMRGNMPIDPEWLIEVAPHYHKRDQLDKLGMDKKMGKQGQGKVGV
ncbi:P-loop containing nucleoside triphosphate hydrolase protein [Aaosphaeria arxii CBS 175.79]|uniref:RNA helicase n=1 Tax=Aaosphaeria arxii CBS 175.79 TaxID=1450172 RepID=A0A6A5XHI8_9PLEO|nr:P-loop containing nucleoside triphosphate hydrolase protein [Aaosphaeria arxii CBS 175.79]KAF2012316.1 P-loop containing nucleoside triphosphate hydrolase protein [Aaosphaeria arxii CBS 175.79]